MTEKRGHLNHLRVSNSVTFCIFSVSYNCHPRCLHIGTCDSHCLSPAPSPGAPPSEHLRGAVTSPGAWEPSPASFTQPGPGHGLHASLLRVWPLGGLSTLPLPVTGCWTFGRFLLLRGMQVSVWTDVFSSVGLCLGVELLGHIVLFSFWRNC